MKIAIELLTRILCDTRPVNPTDGAYLYCQTKENQPSVFQAARFLLTHSYTSKIWMLHTTAKNGYPGFDNGKHRLLDMGIGERQILGVTGPETSNLHTRIESEALIRFAKKQGYTSLFVVAPPFQQIRAFMTAVTVALEEFPQLCIYSFPGSALPWQEEVVHSQGQLRARRYDLIHEELARIETYQQKGDLAPFEPVLEYLNQREALADNRI